MLAPLEVRLLDVPVVLETDDPAVRAILARCYRDALVTHADPAALVARLTTVGGAYAIDVEGREPVQQHERTDAVRSFNHELAHGVMLRSRRHFFVHAGVVARGGHGIVLPGLSRAGKSTLVLALLERGAAFLSDELLAFDPEARTAHAFPRSIKIRDESLDYFPERAATMVGQGEGRFFPASAAFPLADGVPIRLVVCPRWDPTGDDRLHPTTRGETLLALTASALNIGSHGSAASVGHLSMLVQATEGYRVEWRDPHRTADAIVRALDGATGQRPRDDV